MTKHEAAAIINDPDNFADGLDDYTEINIARKMAIDALQVKSTENQAKFCQFETPCGWCVRLNKECPEKGRCKKKKKAASDNADKKMLNPAGEYAAKFAENHRMSISDALEHPMVKAGMDFFNQTGK